MGNLPLDKGMSIILKKKRKEERRRMSTLNPLPKSLRSECNRAAKILRDFTMPDSNKGPDKLIPKSLLMRCKGLAIITVVRAGFLFAMRAGSGLVVARLGNGDWSAPTCVVLGGMGGGFEIGGEITNFVILLNSDAAVKAFSKGGNVTFGGSLSVAAGPLGRNVEADVAVRSPSAIYTYSRTRGLYAGISIEGSVLIERKGANRKIYGDGVRSRDLLSGKYPPPQEAANLYHALNDMTGGTFGKFAHSASSAYSNYKSKRSSTIMMTPSRLSTISDGDSTAPRRPTYSSSSSSSSSSKGKSFKSMTRGAGKSLKRLVSGKKKTQLPPQHALASAPMANFSSGFLDESNKNAAVDEAHQDLETKSVRRRVKKQAHIPTQEEWDKLATATAVFNFKGTLENDLSFKKGDVIEIISRSGTQDDWWEGQFNGVVGIFPANYVKVD